MRHDLSTAGYFDTVQSSLGQAIEELKAVRFEVGYTKHLRFHGHFQ